MKLKTKSTKVAPPQPMPKLSRIMSMKRWDQFHQSAEETEKRLKKWGMWDEFIERRERAKQPTVKLKTRVKIKLKKGR